MFLFLTDEYYSHITMEYVSYPIEKQENKGQFKI